MLSGVTGLCLVLSQPQEPPRAVRCGSFPWHACAPRFVELAGLVRTNEE